MLIRKKPGTCRQRGAAFKECPQVKGYICDVTNRSQSIEMINDIATNFGLDVLVANSPGAATAPFLEMTDDMWRDAAEAGIRPNQACEEAFGIMKSSGKGGRILYGGDPWAATACSRNYSRVFKCVFTEHK